MPKSPGRCVYEAVASMNLVLPIVELRIDTSVPLLPDEMFKTLAYGEEYLFKKSTKDSSSLQIRGGSSPALPSPHVSKGKQIEQGHGEVVTHFISLPLAIYPELKQKVEAFRNYILGDNNDKKPLKFQRTLDEMGIEKSMFISPNSLHLTVVMLKLENKEAVDAAQDILKSVSASVRHALDNRPVFIRLKGLDCMNGSLDKTRVLYAPVEEVGGDGRLLRACSILLSRRAYFYAYIIIDAFVNVGFAGKDAKSRLKLHVTMMNATYRRDKSKGMTFDGREIHKEFGRTDWGEYLIREAQISKRFCFIVCDRSDDNHVKTDLFKDSSKQNLSLGNHGGSSTDHPSPHVSKGKQIVQVYRELYTHFISFPLAIHPELKEKVETFRNSILGDNKDKKPLKFQSTLDEMGIENRMFISPNSLHLTVVMLRLVNKEAVDAAQDILKVEFVACESISACVMYALDNRPVFIRLKGLSSMNGSLEKTRVLYAPVEEVGDEGRLLRAYTIIDAFANAGFAGRDAKLHLKLHVTLMNTTYRRDERKSNTFDAREIHKEFGEKDWGEYLIREAQISKRFWYDADGYFHCCGSLPFPH
uniref:A-kinase anchor protein 7-like phosphoesterase domain-containing protein n=1 Tax=Brassica campestris TaxID=3711 RepID=M4DXC4_BRACM